MTTSPSSTDSPGQPPVSRILETCLYVADLDRAIAFYRRVFGFNVMSHDDRMCALAVPNREALLLFRRGASEDPSETPFGVIPGHGGQGVQHLCFAIPRDTLGAWRAHLLAQAVPVESELTWPYGSISLYFRDPDDHSLEVATPGLWPNDRPGSGETPGG
ncbi:VOC family protein [Rhodopila sp.]|uniref:VOC family protein n=1 Tax=Rhodopila sp. TaxID=2480087 RepID=UPI002B702CA7|nr:VOC family protein [Rhodopila sp.]HVZ06951.1 VOC family protein [Rhodopila sp.]